MLQENLQINIGANTQDLQAGLNQATNSVTNFSNSVQKASKPTADATNALGNLSRVAQDAPYGFMGIANNLNPLLESFQRLQKESGGAGNALKAMASGLMGPAGIGLALGAVSSLLVVFSDKLFQSSDKQKELAEKSKEHADALKEQKNAIEQIYSATAKEATQVSSLIAVLDNENESRYRKQKALEELKKINPEIFNGLKLEEGVVVGLNTAYEQYINSLSSIITLKIKQKELEDVTEKILKAQGVTLSQEEKDLIKTGKAINDKVNAQRTDIEQRNNVTKSLTEQNKKELELNGLLEQRKKIFDSIKEVSPGIKISGSTSGGGAGRDNDLDEKLAQIQRQIKLNNDWADSEMKLFQARSKFNRKDGLGIEEFQMNKGDKTPQKLDKDLPNWAKDYISETDKLDEQFKMAQKSAEDFANTISNSVTNGLMSMFDAMQQGESPLQALSNFFADLLKQMAAAVVQAVIFQTIMTALGFGGVPGAGGGGGGFLGKILGFAEGGIVSRPTVAMVGEGGQSEAIMPLNKLGNMLTSTFQAGAMNGGGGGEGNGQFVLKGSDLVLAMQRSNFSLNVRR